MHATTNRILRLLLAGSPLSGETIARSLNFSRSAIWKHIEELRLLGFEIEGGTGKGYRLVHSPDALYEALVHHEYTPRSFGQQIIYFKECGSTNAELKLLAERSTENGSGLVVVTDHQTTGRGRRGRTWLAEEGEALLFSVLLRPPFPPSQLHGLTLMTGVAVVEALLSLGLATSLKWPNDVCYEGRKLCGILAETSAELDHTNYVVLGIGINVGGHPSELTHISTSLKDAGIRPRRAKLLAEVLLRLEENYDLYLNRQTEAILAKWRLNSHTLGRRVTVYTVQEEFTGLAREITPEGALVVKLDSGEERVVTAGDVSVR